MEVFNTSLGWGNSHTLRNMGQRISEVSSDSRFSASEISLCSLIVSFYKEPVCIKFSVCLLVPSSVHSLLTEN